MEKPSSVVDGGIRLPIGYRFHPTDEELLVYYLKRKVFALPLPASVIPEFDVFQTDPWGIPGDLREKRYFFRTRKSVDNKKRKTAAGSGYWKPVGKEKQILASESNRVLGTRRTLVFCGMQRSNGTKTRWVMHEYRLVDSATVSYSNQVSVREMGDWVVYSVFQSLKTHGKQGFTSQSSNSKKTRRLVMTSPAKPSSSCSSEITEVSSNGLDQEETSSHVSFSSSSCM